MGDGGEGEGKRGMMVDLWPNQYAQRGQGSALPHLDALHCDVVDDPDDTTRTSHSQKGMTGAAVVGPCARVEVLISLQEALSQGNNWAAWKKPKGLKEEQGNARPSHLVDSV